MEGVDWVINSKSKTFIAFCFCFLCGIGLASIFDWSSNQVFSFYVILIIILFFTAYNWQNKKIRFLLFAIAILIFGILRNIFFTPQGSDPSSLSYYFNERINIRATIVEDPVRKISSAEYSLGSISEKNIIKEKMLVRMPLYPEFNYGDNLELICTISAPKNFDDSFRYDKYLAVQGIYAICDYPEIISVASHQKNNFFGSLLKFKNVVRRKVALLWPEPMSSLMAGLIYGERSGFAPELSEDFRRTGLSHIVAVSGYNVSVIAGFLLSVLIIFGLYRRPALVLSIISVVLFVIFVGASASAIRAGIMGSVVLVGQYIGRPSRAAPALVFAAALMVAFNPLILIWDAGFQLSCLATAGIIFSPKPGRRFLEPLVTTLAATIATLPLILMQFGRLSSVSVFVNMLVIWLIPWLMLLGFVAVAVSAIFMPAAFLIASAANLGLKYVIFIAEKFSALKISSVEISFSPWLMILSYVIIILLAKKYGKTKNQNI